MTAAQTPPRQGTKRERPRSPLHGGFSAAARRLGCHRTRLSKAWRGEVELPATLAVAVMADRDLGELVDFEQLTGAYIPPGTRLAPGVVATAEAWGRALDLDPDLSDRDVLDAVATAARQSGHPDLADALARAVSNAGDERGRP